MVDRNHGALIEEFIEGREFTCLVADNAEDLSDPIAYEPVEFVFLEEQITFKYAALKFEEFTKMKAVEINDREVAEKVKEICKRFYKAIDFESYSRFDLRMDKQGNIYVLEINSIPCMFYTPDRYGSADEIIMRAPGGHAAFLDNLMQVAIVRHQLKQLGWRIEHSTILGYICRSVKPFQKGDAIIDLSSKQVKVESVANLTRAAEANAQIKMLPRFYWPLSPTLVLTSENEVSQYKFLQHSEDPNCWLDGELRIGARRGIAGGELLTFDYSTLYGDDWRNLLDRGEKSKFDWALLAKKYEGHVSSFVEWKIRNPTVPQAL